MDKTNGYEKIAAEFIRVRGAHIGTDVVVKWAQNFPAEADVLELGCGHGSITKILVEQGLNVVAIDASPSLLAEFHKRFPHVETECAAVEDSEYFNRKFDGVVAWGLMFLLTEDVQRVVLSKIAKALNPGGRLLFTAPREIASWTDTMTGMESRSLGKSQYELILHELGFEMESGQIDSGDNYYYLATKIER